MSISGGIINAPVNGNDPYDLLGVPKQPSGYDVGYICSNEHGRINKWAKYKPIEYSGKYGVLTEQDYIDKYYGIDVPYFDFQSMPNGLWKYSSPTTAFRLSDFNKYDHKAIVPIWIGWLYGNQQRDSHVQVDMVFNDIDDRSTLSVIQIMREAAYLRPTLILCDSGKSILSYYVLNKTFKQIHDESIRNITMSAPLSPFSIGNKVYAYVMASQNEPTALNGVTGTLLNKYGMSLEAEPNIERKEYIVKAPPAAKPPYYVNITNVTFQFIEDTSNGTKKYQVNSLDIAFSIIPNVPSRSGTIKVHFLGDDIGVNKVVYQIYKEANDTTNINLRYFNLTDPYIEVDRASRFLNISVYLDDIFLNEQAFAVR